MEAGRARNRGNPPFRLSLGLTSVRNIVDRLEAECANGVLNSGLEVVKYQDCSEGYSAVLSGLEVVKFDPNIASDDDFTFATSNGKVASKLALSIALALSRCVPSVTLANFGVLSVATGLLAPRMISYLVLYPFCRLVFGTLYPAYASYKAVRTKNLKEYVKWMMYWIVFALFTCTETFTDVFLSWFPFYYEVKIVLVLWLLSPATKGSSILYRKFVHPALCRREQEIDEYIAKAKDQGYHTVLNLGTKGVNYATTVIMQTAIKGGGGLVQQLRKSYSLSDLTECEPREERGSDEADDVLAEPRLIRRAVKSSYAARRSASESNSRQPIYFPEVDVDVRSTRSSRSDEPDFSHIKSTEDISSGYSSADNSACLTRAGSVGAAGRARARTPRTAVTTVKRPPAAEDNEVFIEELQDDNLDNYSDLVNVSCLYLSHTNPPFIYQYVGDQVKIIKVLGQLPLDDEANPKSTVTIQKGQTDNRNKESSNNTVYEQTDEINEKREMSSTILGSPENSNEGENKLNAEKSLTDDQTNVTKVDKKCFEHIETKDDVKDGSTDVVKVSSDIKNDSKVNMQVKQTSKDVEPESVTETFGETLSDNYSSDDEASYGTPNDSPNTTRKLVKGKYGKNKAPLPPVVDKVVQQIDVTDSVKETSKEEYKLNLESSDTQNINQSISTDSLFLEDTSKMRQKSKSPIRVPKPGASGLGKLLQLPSKFAFWHKPGEKPLSDDISVSSGDQSRRTSADDLEKRSVDSDLNSKVSESIINVPLKDNSTTEITEIRDTDKESTQNIIEKSDVLQKLIEAKLESHPEYKFVPLSADNEIQTTSKSTDV